MTTLTIALAAGGPSSDDLERAAGRADAYDDHAHMTTDQLAVRAGYLIDYHPIQAYAQGYAAYVAGERLAEQQASGRTGDRART